MEEIGSGGRGLVNSSQSPDQISNQSNPSTPKTKASINLVKSDKSKNKFKVATWNIKRGLVKRELEIKELLKNEEINILFLTESDIILGKTDDYKIEGFTTVFQKRESENEKIRVVAFIKEDVESQIIVKENLMSFEVPSIWLELKAEHSVPFIICGVYREWAHNFDSSEAAQIKQMEEFASHIKTG